MILDNDTSSNILFYCPLASTGSPDMALFRDRHLPRQTPARLIRNVCAILIQCWPTIFDVGTPLFQHVIRPTVVHTAIRVHTKH